MSLSHEMHATPALSVVTTLYKSARHLEEFHRRMVQSAAAITSDYEIVFVNDGSPDDSLAVALAIQRRDPRVRVVDLSRNFGHHPAMMEGLRRSRGALVFLIDCDLEELPEWLTTFHERMNAGTAEAVYGVQTARKGGWFERFSGWLFFRLFASMLRLPLVRNAVTARLMTRRFVDALIQFRERDFGIVSLCALTGFAQESVPVRKLALGRTTYSVGLRIGAMVNAVTSFSSRPLVLVFQLGCAIMAVSIASAAVIMYLRLIGGVGVPGYTSLVVSIWFLGGLMIFCIGLVGVYLAKVFNEVKQRPLTIVRAEYPGAGRSAESGDMP